MNSKSKTKKTKNTLEIPFENLKKQRKNLINLLRNEKSFLIQIFSLESVEFFENFLKIMKIEFRKGFTSNSMSFSTKIKDSEPITLLIDDGQLNTINSTKNKIILFSNKRNYEFIPYRFQLDQNEKSFFIKDKMTLETSKEMPITKVISKSLDPFEYTASGLNYTQSIIVMCMLKEHDFSKICKEVKTVDPNLDNSFLIKMELNWLCLNDYSKKIKNNYRLTISNESVQRICNKINFERVFQ